MDSCTIFAIVVFVVVLALLVYLHFAVVSKFFPTGLSGNIASSQSAQNTTVPQNAVSQPQTIPGGIKITPVTDVNSILKK